MTSLDMVGVSLTLMALDDERTHALDAETQVGDVHLRPCCGFLFAYLNSDRVHSLRVFFLFLPGFSVCVWREEGGRTRGLCMCTEGKE